MFYLQSIPAKRIKNCRAAKVSNTRAGLDLVSHEPYAFANHHVPDPGYQTTQEASHKALESLAAKSVRDSVIKHVMTANPILNAVHNGTDASPIERYLNLPERK
jgi:predicted dienelactone hydrolase